ncbi:hypothetical protein IW261DRAFT_1577102 [Armillaria novae-zelandiae]|uniref:Uncharacterized protein n=1 Tax=Armillaria novae-zelandiae TaxID=153914 RepID=A0AA39N9H9_9AGAR|nr:hypothetical protein IW261DRAFT_1577102 [Armillaria novae-zelandiae]
MSVVITAGIIKGTSPTDDEYLQAAVLGWDIELITCQGEPHLYRVPKANHHQQLIHAGRYDLLPSREAFSYFAGEDVSEGDGEAYRFGCVPEDEVEVSKFSSKNDIQHCIATSYLAVAVAVAACPSPPVNQNIEPYATPNPFGYSPIQDELLDWSGAPE